MEACRLVLPALGSSCAQLLLCGLLRRRDAVRASFLPVGLWMCFCLFLILMVRRRYRRRRRRRHHRLKTRRMMSRMSRLAFGLLGPTVAGIS